jgi:hypothetical protein
MVDEQMQGSENLPEGTKIISDGSMLGTSTNSKRITIFRNGRRDGARVLLITDLSFEEVLQRACILLLSENSPEQFTRVFNSNGGEIIDSDTILHDEALYFSCGEGFTDSNSDTLRLTDTRGAPSRQVIRSVLRHLSSSLDSDDVASSPRSTKLQFMADFDTFSQDVKPILIRSKDLSHDETLSLLWEVFSNHASPKPEENASEAGIMTLRSPQQTLPPPPPPPPPTQMQRPSTDQETSGQAKPAKTKQKRALTGFNLFYRDKCKEFREVHHDPASQSPDAVGRIAPRIAKAWKQLSEEERRSYHEQARIRQQQQLVAGLSFSSSNPKITSPSHQQQPSSQQQQQQDHSVPYHTQLSDEQSSNGGFRFFNYTPRQPTQPQLFQPPSQVPQIPSISALTNQQPTHSYPLTPPSYSTNLNRGRRPYEQEPSSPHLPPIMTEGSSDAYMPYRNQHMRGPSNQFYSIHPPPGGIPEQYSHNRPPVPPQQVLPPYQSPYDDEPPNKKSRFQ